MKSPITTLVAVVLCVLPAASFAATCPDRAPQAINAPPAGSIDCQNTIAKVATNYLKAKMKAYGKCMAEQTPGLCPTAKEIEKTDKAVAKAIEKIAAECADDAAQGGLVSSYGDLTDHAVIPSCMLSQHNATADILLGIFNGTPAEFSTNSARAKCVASLNKAGVKYVTDALKIVNKCIAKQIKDQVAGDLVPICVGQYVGGVFQPPTDEKASEKLAGLATKIEETLATKCVNPESYVSTVFACPGATSLADLQQCVLCEGWDGVLDLVEQQNNEDATYVPHGAGAIQAAVSAAGVGDKLLIAPGDYAEEVSITTDDLQLVGCGGASNARPRVVRPAGPGPFANGMFAANVDGLLFQSLEYFGWDDNGVFVSGANGVTFRDVIADGDVDPSPIVTSPNSEYGIFPVQSDNVLIEGCTVRNVDDAGIYVGQSTNILVRYNTTNLNVAGIEIENSGSATVHNNYSFNNTGGLMIFKLPGLPVQLSNDHVVFNNVLIGNNTVNFGIPGSTVSLIPDGTGLFILSNDDGDFHHNLIQNNNTFGIVLLDQEAVNALAGPAFVPPSPDQKAEGNFIHDNELSGNGGAIDSTPPNNSPFGANMLMALIDSTDHDNCFQANSSPLFEIPGFGSSDCTP
jgi:parallel beta-helix repeat protein